jgi:hypothetical protein
MVEGVSGGRARSSDTIGGSEITVRRKSDRNELEETSTAEPRERESPLTVDRELRASARARHSASGDFVAHRLHATFNGTSDLDRSDEDRVRQIREPSDLDAAERSSLEATLRGDRGEEAKKRLSTVLDGITTLDASDQAKVLRPLAQNPSSDAAREVERIVSSNAWKLELDQRQRADLVSVIDAARSSPGVLSDLASITTQSPTLLLSKDANDEPLITNLASLATQELHPGFASRPPHPSGLDHHGAISREAILGGVLSEIADPNRIDQGGKNTCTVTSMQYELVRRQPAEYARIMARLTSRGGEAWMQGGGKLQLQARNLVDDPRESRSASDMIFQSAAMRYATNDLDYNAWTDARARPDGSWTTGLYPEEERRVLDGLFGPGYRVWSSNPENVEHQTTLMSRIHPDAARPVLLDLRIRGEAGSPNAVYHSVALVEVKGDRVYFRNPWAARTGDPSSYGAQNEDGWGLQSMSLSELRSRLDAVHLHGDNLDRPADPGAGPS